MSLYTISYAKTYIRSFILMVLCGIWSLVGISPAIGAEPIKVVATFSILADVVKQVGGDEVDVQALIAPNVDAHTFDPSPRNVADVSVADIIFASGLGYEPWLQGLIDATGRQKRLVIVSDACGKLTADNNKSAQNNKLDDLSNTSEEKKNSKKHEHGKKEHSNKEKSDKHVHLHKHEHSHDHDGGVDPHVWQDVACVRVWAKSISDALAAVRPEATSVFRERFLSYDGELAALDEWIRKTIAGIPAAKNAQRVIITSHDAFMYYGKAYGIDFRSPVGFATDIDPSPAAVAKLINYIRDNGIRSVFLENMASPTLLESIARDSGAKVGGVLYADALSNQGGEAASYVDMMRVNTQRISDSLALSSSR